MCEARVEAFGVGALADIQGIVSVVIRAGGCFGSSRDRRCPASNCHSRRVEFGMTRSVRSGRIGRCLSLKKAYCPRFIASHRPLSPVRRRRTKGAEVISQPATIDRKQDGGPSAPSSPRSLGGKCIESSATPFDEPTSSHPHPVPRKPARPDALTPTHPAAPMRAGWARSAVPARRR